jgi:hypothetical protein
MLQIFGWQFKQEKKLLLQISLDAGVNRFPSSATNKTNDSFMKINVFVAISWTIWVEEILSYISFAKCEYIQRKVQGFKHIAEWCARLKMYRISDQPVIWCQFIVQLTKPWWQKCCLYDKTYNSMLQLLTTSHLNKRWQERLQGPPSVCLYCICEVHRCSCQAATHSNSDAIKWRLVIRTTKKLISKF